jgi:cyclophilin family peptidyl-prolyl cis-trans isomerase
MTATPPPLFYLKWTTSRGLFFTASRTDWAPALVTRLYNLVINNFYAGTKFYRVLPGFVNQWGVHGDPSIAEIYNWRRNFPGAIVQPQPGETPLQRGQTNVAGAISFSTSYLQRANRTGLSWNATAELFVNLVDNPRLDANHFIPVAIVTSGLDVLASCYSYGRMADECDPPDAKKCPGPDEVTLYAKGNSYLDAAYPRMDFIVSVQLFDPNATNPSSQDSS